MGKTFSGQEAASLSELETFGAFERGAKVACAAVDFFPQSRATPEPEVLGFADQSLLPSVYPLVSMAQ